MKKTFLVLAVLLMFGSSAFAIGGIDLSIGPKIGYQTAKLSYQKSDIKADFANSFTVGLFGRVEIGGFYVQPEVLWFRSKNAFTMNIDKDENQIAGFDYPNGLQFTMTRNAMNIQVPVLFGYKYDLGIVGIRAQAGPTANFVIPGKTLVQKSASLDGEAEFPAALEEAEFDTKGIAWGVQMGIGADILGFTLDINYNLGISKVFGGKVIQGLAPEWYEAIDLNNIDQTKQNLFMVTIGYKFL
jgi:hypothetical protein